MSASDTSAAPTAAGGHHTDEEHAGTHPTDEHHPTPRQYVQVAVILGVLTAMEVSTYFVEVGAAFLPTLVILMAIKFVLVAGWFMHLKFDTPLFTRLMVVGLVLAVSLYAVVIAIFGGFLPGA